MELVHHIQTSVGSLDALLSSLLDISAALRSALSFLLAASRTSPSVVEAALPDTISPRGTHPTSS
jgi:hypothetical protein